MTVTKVKGAAIMNKRELDKYRKKLTGMLEELEAKASGSVENLNAANDYFPDPTDRATAESDRNFDLRVQDRERKLIKKVKQALERVEEGEFGSCEDCGETIGKTRLEARPMTTLCIDCKIQREQKEKARGD